jgi:hypothetical protein
MTASTARRYNVRSLRSGELESASTATWGLLHVSLREIDNFIVALGAIRREDRPAASAASEDTDRSGAA